MNNKMLGDFPEEYKELAKQLKEFEPQIENDKFPPEKKAQMYVCLAHDWYQIGLEDEGGRLLKKADKAFPNYFENTMMKQAEKDENFATIVNGLAQELLSLVMEEDDFNKFIKK